MTKFKVGDIITGGNYTPYSITTSYAKMRVLGICLGGEDLEVEIIKHEVYPHNVGGVFQVNSSYFKLVKPISLENK